MPPILFVPPILFRIGGMPYMRMREVFIALIGHSCWWYMRMRSKRFFIALVGFVLVGAFVPCGARIALADDAGVTATSPATTRQEFATTAATAIETDAPATADTSDFGTPETASTAHPVWTLEGVNAPASIISGDVTLSAKTTGDIEGAVYNYVWQYGDSWKKGDWDSAVNQSKDGQNSTKTSWKFRLTRPGTYHLYVDVVSRDGVKRTASATLVVVAPKWSCSGVALAAPAAVGPDGAYTLKAGDSAKVSARLSGDTEGATFNYVWQLGDSWKKGEWGSTVLDTGGQTPDAGWNFSPAKAGTYNLYVDVRDRAGVQRTYKTTVTVTGPKWSCSGVALAAPAAVGPDGAYTLKAGDSAKVSARLSGDTEGATFNYVWQLGDSWKKGEWGARPSWTPAGRPPTTAGTSRPPRRGLTTLRGRARPCRACSEPTRRLSP